MRPSHLPRALTVEECERLLAACKDADLRALVAFLWASGTRINEALTLTWADVDCDDRKAVVKGKGGKERVVLFDAGTAVLLRQCLAAPVGLQATPAPPQRPTEHLWPRSRQAYSLRLASAGRRASIEGMHFHLLRHSFATHLLDGGADLITVMSLLGHVKCDTTRIYWNFTGGRLDTLRKSIATSLPRARHYLLSHPTSITDLRSDRLDP